MADFFAHYWPHIFFALSVVVGVAAAIHAAMTKDDVRAAIGWVGIVILSPFIGALLYAVAGINRVRQQATNRRHAATGLKRGTATISPVDVATFAAGQFVALKTLVDSISGFPLATGNSITPLNGGDETYPAMIEAIDAAEKSVVLQSYIFDSDIIGNEIVAALARAQKRGVEIRVLVDAIGARYSRPPVTRALARAGIPHALFNGAVIGFRMPYANLRSHRKVLVIDGRIGLTGGMNIRQVFTTAFAGSDVMHDRHFRITGPIVSQLLASFMHDWQVTTGEELSDGWFADMSDDADNDDAKIAARVVPSGPDRNLAKTHNVLLGAITVAQSHIRISSPYFLPDQQLIGALAVAAQRGVTVDIVLPSTNNLKLVDYAMTAQLDQLLRPGCRIWRATGAFDHSKLMTVDGAWSYVGSSNIDPRSLRLNFELDVEIYDRKTAADIEAAIDTRIRDSLPETLATLQQRPFWQRLRNRMIWLASPYL